MSSCPQPLIALYAARKSLQLRILATHGGKPPDLSPEARNGRKPMWAELDYLNAKIKVYKQVIDI